MENLSERESQNDQHLPSSGPHENRFNLYMTFYEEAQDAFNKRNIELAMYVCNKMLDIPHLPRVFRLMYNLLIATSVPEAAEQCVAEAEEVLVDMKAVLSVEKVYTNSTDAKTVLKAETWLEHVKLWMNEAVQWEEPDFTESSEEVDRSDPKPTDLLMSNLEEYKSRKSTNLRKLDSASRRFHISRKGWWTYSGERITRDAQAV